MASLSRSKARKETMSKHKELLKHRHLTKVGLTEDGGLIIRFDDESHTYLPPDLFKEIVETYNELENIFIEEE